MTPDGQVKALGNPRRLFAVRLANPPSTRVMDAAGDGNRFVVLLRGSEGAAK